MQVNIDRNENSESQTQSKSERNTFVLNKLTIEALSQFKETKIQQLLKKVWIKVAIVGLIIFGALSFLNLLFLIGLIISIIIIVCHVVTLAERDADEYLSDILNPSLNIFNFYEISSLQGILILLETVKESEYSECVSSIPMEQMYSIKGSGNISNEESKSIAKTYWRVLQNLILAVSNNKGVDSGGTRVASDLIKKIDVVKLEVEKQQENFIRNTIIQVKKERD